MVAESVIAMKISSYWVSIAAVALGGLMIWGTMVGYYRVGANEALLHAANILAGGMIVSTGIFSLTILHVFDNRKNDKEK